MEIHPELRKSIDHSILCWLATVDKKGHPSVSPKEMFYLLDDHQLIIANIASPQSVRNIKNQSKVCVSMIDILVQKGCQLYGTAEVISDNDDRFIGLSKPFISELKGIFTFRELICVTIEKTKQILAPSYQFFPETKEEDQILAARKSYGL